MLKQKLARTTRSNLLLLGILILLVVFFSLQNDRFLSMYNIMNIVRQNVPQVIIGCAMMFVIAGGAIDLSVAGVMALSAIVYGKLCVAGLNAWVAVFAVVFVGIAVGWVNTFITEKLQIPAIMATMATWLAAEGLALTLVQAIPISDPEVKPVTVLNQVRFFGDQIPLALFIVLAIVLIFLFLEKKTLIGKYAIAIGGNSNAAYFSGINVRKMRFVFFALCSVMAALAGIWQVARLGSADPKIGTGMEFNVISACILGGVNIKGGEGSIVGVVIGTYLLAILTNGMQMMSIDAFYQQVVIGVVLLAAVLTNQFTAMRAAHKAAMAGTQVA